MCICAFNRSDGPQKRTVYRDGMHCACGGASGALARTCVMVVDFIAVVVLFVFLIKLPSIGNRKQMDEIFFRSAPFISVPLLYVRRCSVTEEGLETTIPVICVGRMSCAAWRPIETQRKSRLAHIRTTPIILSCFQYMHGPTDVTRFWDIGCFAVMSFYAFRYRFCYFAKERAVNLYLYFSFRGECADVSSVN